MSSNEVISSYRNWVSQHRIAAGILAGIIATQVATICGYWMAGVNLVQLDWNRANGGVYSPKGSAMEQFVTGGAMHYLDGIVFTLMFVIVIHPLLPWKDTGWGNLGKAFVFGTALALFSLGFMVPFVFYPKFNPGLFSFNLGGKTVFAVLLWHWIFALHLGAVYNPLPTKTIE